MVTIEIQTKEMLRLVKIELQNDSVRIESGAMYYMIGNIDIEAKMPSVGGFLKAMVTKEHAVRPVYTGTGVLFLEPSYGNFTILDLQGEEWILDKGAYYASEMGVNIDIFTNKAMTSLFSGEGYFQTKVSGTGKVVLASGGPLETIELKNERLVVDGAFAVARTGNIEFKVEKATKGLLGTAASGEGLVNTFTGSGKVLVSPAPHRDAFVEAQFKALQMQFASQKKS